VDKSVLLDTLASFFKSLFHMNGLVDVAPVEKMPTWRNDRASDACITKRLDRFHLAKALLSTVQRFRTWVEYPYLSNHAPVLLEFGIYFPIVASSFKLNPDWLKEESFVEIVRQVWNDPRHLLTVGAQRCLVGKISLLKERIKVWVREKRQKDQSDLLNIEEAIEFKYNQVNLGLSSLEDSIKLSKLESKRNCFLMAEEESWRQKI
jgi:hypothetical protein